MVFLFKVIVVVVMVLVMEVVMALVMVVVMVLTPQPWGPERVPVGHRRLQRTHKDKF